VSALEETFGATGTLLREAKGEVVLVSRSRPAFERLNPALPAEALTAAADNLTRDRSATSLEAANPDVHLLLKEGIRVGIAYREPSPRPSPKGRGSSGSTPHSGPLPGRGREGVKSGGQKTEQLRVIDWEQTANSDFLLVS
jgi:type I restriction enzyme, R subunit